MHHEQSNVHIMRNITFQISILFSLLAFISCEKETVTPVVKDIDHSLMYLNNVDTDVLFASVQLNHELDKLSGWIIDKKGNVRSIQHDQLINIDQEIISIAPIESLYVNSEIVKSLDTDELVNMHKLSRSQIIPNDMETIQNESTTSAYISYHIHTRAEDSDECSDCSDHESDKKTETTYSQFVLHASGHFNTPSDDRAQLVQDYLNSIEEELSN